MKLSISLISILLTGALALSVKRQNDVPDCVNGDSSGKGPYETMAECEDDCRLVEREGDNVEGLCQGHCFGTPLITGTVVYNCASHA